MMMHIVTCSNYFDLNKMIALRMGVSKKNIDFVTNFHKNFQVICPSCLHKIFQCWINQENLFHVVDGVDHENKKNAFKPINSILYGCMRVIIDREERYALHSAEVYMCLEQNIVFICQLSPKTCRYIQNLLSLTHHAP